MLINKYDHIEYPVVAKLSISRHMDNIQKHQPGKLHFSIRISGYLKHDRQTDRQSEFYAGCALVRGKIQLSIVNSSQVIHVYLTV